MLKKSGLYSFYITIKIINFINFSNHQYFYTIQITFKSKPPTLTNSPYLWLKIIIETEIMPRLTSYTNQKTRP